MLNVVRREKSDHPDLSFFNEAAMSDIHVFNAVMSASGQHFSRQSQRVSDITAQDKTQLTSGEPLRELRESESKDGKLSLLTLIEIDVQSPRKRRREEST